MCVFAHVPGLHLTGCFCPSHQQLVMCFGVMVSLPGVAGSSEGTERPRTFLHEQVHEALDWTLGLVLGSPWIHFLT